MAQTMTTQQAMRPALVLSALFHGALVIIAIFGLPFLASKEINIPDPVTIQIVTPEDVKKEKPKKPVPEKPKPIKKEKPKPKPEAKKEPLKPKPAKPAPAPTQTSSVQPSTVPAVQTEAKLDLPKEMPKPRSKPRPPPLKEEKKEEPPKKVEEKEKEKPPEDAFASVLKNLAEDVEMPVPQEKEEEPPQPAKTKTVTDHVPISERMTMSDLDALRLQLATCWNVPAGARDVENLNVIINVIVNPDRTVKKVSVVDARRYGMDTFYRAMADSAMRALRNPLCNPLNLPEEKYSQWHDLNINFNPSEMF